jgi:hypothetical protein
MTHTRRAGNATDRGGRLVYGRQPSACLRGRRGITISEINALSSGLLGEMIGLDTQDSKLKSLRRCSLRWNSSRINK